MEGWQETILLESDTIRECETHGWMHDRADPRASVRALLVASEEPHVGLLPEQAVMAVQDVFNPYGERNTTASFSLSLTVTASGVTSWALPSSAQVKRPRSSPPTNRYGGATKMYNCADMGEVGRNSF